MIIASFYLFLILNTRLAFVVLPNRAYSVYSLIPYGIPCNFSCHCQAVLFCFFFGSNLEKIYISENLKVVGDYFLNITDISFFYSMNIEKIGKDSLNDCRNLEIVFLNDRCEFDKGFLLGSNNLEVLNCPLNTGIVLDFRNKNKLKFFNNIKVNKDK
jgi:hypothetical protein